ncbi:hypothetical protein [Anaeromyxobacter diazotrophicus]|uniref:Uncharacterized protein n=1 Tax=Anaeromyxobacter diazotrophicus TaxID=2590199 RepID=A0A7I9VRT0_9BACT|nr:hypothetical protein [Anaeromyxobacter diazotrophicus]GEJ58637.1 hypothetical protein AMYX_33780 [Anaeromyxobacter diazotrophicus]
MLSTFTILFLFRFGSIPPPRQPAISFRAEAHAAAVESAAAWAPLHGPASGAEARGDGPGDPGGLDGPDLPLLYGTGPVQGPLRPAYRPSEWVSSVAHQLHLADHPLARAALWLSGIPVQVDARPPGKVVVRLTLRGF